MLLRGTQHLQPWIGKRIRRDLRAHLDLALHDRGLQQRAHCPRDGVVEQAPRMSEVTVRVLAKRPELAVQFDGTPRVERSENVGDGVISLVAPGVDVQSALSRD